MKRNSLSRRGDMTERLILIPLKNANFRSRSTRSWTEFTVRTTNSNRHLLTSRRYETRTN